MNITIKRIYDPKEPGDGYRVLVDRLWPRGISKEKASWDEWLKNIAPSTALRQWFAHDPVRWDAFRKKYDEELDGNGEAVSPSATAGAEREGYSALLRQEIRSTMKLRL